MPYYSLKFANKEVFLCNFLFLSGLIYERSFFVKKFFLGGYKKMIKKAFSIGICAAFMLTILPIGRQNFVAESASPTSSEIALTPNANTQTTIPIAMATDNNYTHVTLVSIASALENADTDTKLKFYIMVPGDFSEDNKRKIQKVNDSFKNGEIEIINMGDSFKEFYKGIWGATMYYRLKLPSILKNEAKCIYLDGDTLVLKDLNDMYNLDISEYYVAGTPDGFRNRKKYGKRIKIPDMNDYINSGVILLNLAKMREDNIENKFYKLLTSELKNTYSPIFAFPDQDTINVACHGKILDLPFKYGALSLCLSSYNENHFKGIISKEDWLIEKKDIAIIHFAGRYKPWNDSKSPFRNMWEKYEHDLTEILKSYEV
ncbi:MAG TPA: hypothetical protein DCW90_18875 [Lachnospiraceae bacterium]|nr:hypothetical protein [Lachnospiraceae bacterium]